MYNQKVTNYIEDLPENEKAIAIHTRALLFNLVNGIEEKFSFKIPFYHHKGKMFCYINKKKIGLEFCIRYNQELLLFFPQLVVGNRKLFAGITLVHSRDIIKNNLAEIIVTATL